MPASAGGHLPPNGPPEPPCCPNKTCAVIRAQRHPRGRRRIPEPCLSRAREFVRKAVRGLAKVARLAHLIDRHDSGTRGGIDLSRHRRRSEFRPPIDNDVISVDHGIAGIRSNRRARASGNGGVTLRFRVDAPGSDQALLSRCRTSCAGRPSRPSTAGPVLAVVQPDVHDFGW
jgi:hypothetical protein